MPSFCRKVNRDTIRGLCPATTVCLTPGECERVTQTASHAGGGWYETSDGLRLKGKAATVAAGYQIV